MDYNSPIMLRTKPYLTQTNLLDQKETLNPPKALNTQNRKAITPTFPPHWDCTVTAFHLEFLLSSAAALNNWFFIPVGEKKKSLPFLYIYI